MIQCLELRAREVRSHREVRSDPWHKRLTERLVATGDVIRFRRTGKRPEGPIGRQARLGLLLEELGVLQAALDPCSECKATGDPEPLKKRGEGVA